MYELRGTWRIPGMKFRAEVVDGNIFYVGHAPPNTGDDDPFWSIEEITNDNGTPIASNYVRKDGIETSENKFVWSLRGSYDYGTP